MPSDRLPDSTQAERDLLLRVKSFLHQRGYRPHRTLEIRVERGVVVVQGRVSTFYLRQIAGACIKRVAGVTQVIDLIEVADDPRQPLPNDNSHNGHVSPEAFRRHRVDLSGTPHTAHDANQTHICNRHCESIRMKWLDFVDLEHPLVGAFAVPACGSR